MGTVEVRDGRPVLVRRGGEALRREAEVLGTIAGDGVPRVVELDDHGDQVQLVTEVCPPLTVPPGAVLGVGAQVAAVLARAHAAGLVHGPLLDEHLRGSADAVVVGGWDAAGPGDPAADVAEVGALLLRFGGADRRVQVHAGRATATTRPSMAALADALRVAASPPSSPRWRPGPVPARWRPPRLALGGLAVAGALVGGGLGFVAVSASPKSRHGAARPAASLPSATSTTGGTTTSTSPALAWRVPSATVEGNVVTRDGERWTVGRPGDVVAVGDWDCDGQPSPAVLRPASGQVWLFPGWTAEGAPEAGRAVGTVPGAVEIRVQGAGRCDRLAVLDADGQSTLLG